MRTRSGSPSAGSRMRPVRPRDRPNSLFRSNRPAMPLSRFEGIVTVITAARRVSLACGGVSPLRRRVVRSAKNRCVAVQLLISPGWKKR